jgi:hypothetical protein
MEIRTQFRNIHFLSGYPATGLNRAFLNTFFPISGLIAWNPEYPILPGEKPACLNLFGRRKSFFMDTTKACAAFPATGALKLYPRKIHFILINIIKIGI